MAAAVAAVVVVVLSRSFMEEYVCILVALVAACGDVTPASALFSIVISSTTLFSMMLKCCVEFEAKSSLVNVARRQEVGDLVAVVEVVSVVVVEVVAVVVVVVVAVKMAVVIVAESIGVVLKKLHLLLVFVLPLVRVLGFVVVAFVVVEV